jgi:hypothetical protein
MKSDTEKAQEIEILKKSAADLEAEKAKIVETKQTEL